MSELSRWWSGRTLREQRLLLALGLLAAAMLYWFGLVSPLRAAAAAAERRHAVAAAELAELESGLARLALLERGRGRLSEPLEGAVRRTAAEAGVGLAALQSGAGGLTVRSEAAAPPAFFRWLATLHGRYGVRVTGLAVLKNPDGSLNVQVVLAGGRA